MTRMDVASRTAIGLDHVALFSPTLESIAFQYEQLGFCLTPLSQHSSPPAPGLEPVKRGTANRCAMLRQGYLELLAVVDPDLDGLGVPEALARYQGVHILAFHTDSPEDTQDRLQAAGFTATIAHLERSVQTPEGTGLARFVQVRTPNNAMPEGRVFMLQHPTRELVWQPQYLSHPNTAVALAEIMVAVADLPEASERYARYLDCPAQRSSGRASFALAQGTFTLIERTALEDDYPGIRIPQMPFPAVLVVRVESLGAAQRVLTANGIDFEQRPGRLVVAAPLAGGAVMVFIPFLNQP